MGEPGQQATLALLGTPNPRTPALTHVVQNSQDHPKVMWVSPQDDEHLHLEGVEEAQVVDGPGSRPGGAGRRDRGSPRRDLPTVSSTRVCPSGPPAAITHSRAAEWHGSEHVFSSSWLGNSAHVPSASSM